MAKLWEQLDVETIGRLVPSVREGLILIEEERQEKSQSADSFFVPKHMQEEVSIPLIKYVHTKMLAQSKPTDKYPGYVGTWQGSISALIEEIVPDWFTPGKIKGLASQTQRMMYANRLVRRVSGRQSPVYKVALWREPDLEGYSARAKAVVKGYSDRTIDLETERQQRRHPEQPVKVSVDLSKLAPPKEPTPEAFREWAVRVGAAVSKMTVENERLKQENHELLDRITELESEVKTQEQKEWEALQSDLQNLFKGES